MRRSALRKLLVLVLAACLVAPATGVSAASQVNRRRPPRVVLRYQGDVVQRVAPYTYCWSYSYPDDSGVGMCADGFPDYPEAAEVSAPARLVLRIKYPVRPHRWFLRAYRAVTSEDVWMRPVGPSEPIRFRLKPHRVHGEVRAWDVVFRVTEPLRDYYLDTGGDLAQGDVLYGLYVRTTP